MATLALLHTAASNVAVFDPLVGELLAGIDHYHVVDESLLREVVANDGVTPFTFERVAAYVEFAQRVGATGVLVTCSSIGAAAEAARSDVSIPVWRVDEPMAVEAGTSASRIGVLATLRTTLDPTTELIRRHAPAGADVRPLVCEGAFAALQAGRRHDHDAAVRAGAERLVAEGADVVVLAQASMARAVDGTLAVPVLTSPRSGVAQCSV
jgi:Asp/Glu/hydantoin racemase